jgi:hypothetical protein
VVGVALAASLFAAASARAATIAVGGPCYLDSDKIMVTGSGFTPGGTVDLKFDGVTNGSAIADGAGNISQQVSAPVLDPTTLEHSYSLTGIDENTLGAAGPVQVRVTQLTATLTPQKARPSRRIRFSVHGMPPGVPLYLHYVYKGRSRATVKLGSPSAPCGVLNVRRRFFPMRNPHTGTWIFQFDDKKSYSAANRPAIRGKVVLFHTFR